MRILMLSNIFPPGFMGGYELGAFEVACGLTSRGHQVDVLTSDYFVDDMSSRNSGTPQVWRTLDCGEPSRSPAEHRERVGLYGCVVPRNLREIAGRLVTTKPDAVLCFNLAGLGAPSILQLLVASGIRPVVYLMDHIFSTLCHIPNWKAEFEKAFGTTYWPEMTRFIFVSQGLRREIEAALGLTASHAQIVPGWCDDRAVAEPVLREGPVRFVFASRIAEHKGVDLLLDACRALLDARHLDFSVDLYGAGDVHLMLQRTTALRLQHHLQYKGAPEKSELMPKLADYDALLFPSWHREPFGFVVAEAAIAGCAPIVSYGIGAAEWFLDNVDCIKIERDPECLKQAMWQMINMRPEQRMLMRQRAYMTATRHFRFSNALTCIEATLQEAALPPSRDPRQMEAALAVLTEVWRAPPSG